MEIKRLNLSIEYFLLKSSLSYCHSRRLLGTVLYCSAPCFGVQCNNPCNIMCLSCGACYINGVHILIHFVVQINPLLFHTPYLGCKLIPCLSTLLIWHKLILWSFSFSVSMDLNILPSSFHSLLKP